MGEVKSDTYKSNRHLKMAIFPIYIHELPVYLRISNDYFTEENELTEWIINVFSMIHKASFFTLCNWA
jgi:hypothetical protein